MQECKGSKTIEKQINPLSGEVGETSRKILGNHPKIRRDLGIPGIEKQLNAIIRHKGLKGAAAVQYIRALADRHERWCRSEQWMKDDGPVCEWSRELAGAYEGALRLEPGKPPRGIDNNLNREA